MDSFYSVDGFDESKFNDLGLSDEQNPSIDAQETFTQDYDASGDVKTAQMFQKLYIDSPETDPRIGIDYSQKEKDDAGKEHKMATDLKNAINADDGTANLNGVDFGGHKIDSIDVNMDMAPIHQNGGHFRSKYSIDGYPARITLDDGSKVDVIFKQDDRTGKYELHKLKAFGGKKDADEIFDYSPTRQAAKNQVKSESLEAAIDKQKAKMGNVMDRLTTTNQARPTRKAQTNTRIDANVISKAEARAAERKQARVKKQQEKELKAEERKQARVKKQQERELKAEERKQERVKKQQEKN